MPICGSNVRKSPQKKRAHDSDSQYAKNEIASEQAAGAGGKKKPSRQLFSNLAALSMSTQLPVRPLLQKLLLKRNLPCLVHLVEIPMSSLAFHLTDL